MGTCARIGCGAPIAESGKRRGRPRKYCSDKCARLALRKRKTSLQQSYRRNLETALAGPECCRDARHPHVSHTAPRKPVPPGFDSPVRGGRVTYAEVCDDKSYYYQHQGEGKPCGPKRRRCDQHNQFRSFERDNLQLKRPQSEQHSNADSPMDDLLQAFLYTDSSGKHYISGRVARNPDAWLSQDADDKRQDAELAKLEKQQYELAA